MLYDNYREKILRRAEILRKIIRFMPVIIAAVSVLLVSAVGLTVLKGTVTDVNFTNSMEYGSTPAGSATALLSKAYFEYSPTGAEQWSTEAPALPGEYDVRVVSLNAFGGKKYKYIDVLTVYPKKVDVTVKDPTITYGVNPESGGADTPELLADLREGDRIVCGGFIYEDALSVATKIKADVTKISIYNEAGEDVTYAYEIATPYTDVMILPRELTIYVADATHEYDGKEFSYSDYEVAEGSLVEGDFLQVTFMATITDAGTVKNTPTISIVNSEGAKVTHFYKINKQEIGSLTVEKRPVHITTGSAEYEYDGKQHQCLSYTVSTETPLVEGHEIVVQGALSLIDAGSADNSMSFSIKDANGRDVTANYSVIVTEGELTVKKRKVTVTT
ncbi:MAG: hypothetical protein IJW21_05795, partial [Clostridia bacterium]|nr:hypothetical protein [Clostridia bacterium]